MPCGQKKRRREIIQSQIVTPPLAAIEGTTFRLNTATTKSNTRSRRPRARIRWGWASDWAVVDTSGNLLKQSLSFRTGPLGPVRNLLLRLLYGPRTHNPITARRGG